MEMVILFVILVSIFIYHLVSDNAWRLSPLGIFPKNIQNNVVDKIWRIHAYQIDKHKIIKFLNLFIIFELIMFLISPGVSLFILILLLVLYLILD